MVNVNIRDIVIGEGIPKICVPIVAKDENDAVMQAKDIVKLGPDMVELRADCLDEPKDMDNIIRVIKGVKNVIKDVVLLFTFRTAKEGGNADISLLEYVNLCRLVCESKLIDIIDVEAYFEENVLKDVVKIAHDNNVYVVASNHDFDATPNRVDITKRLMYMQENDADILKVAVMPNCEEDVLTLMSAVIKYHEDSGLRPVIAMSMGGQGVISRLVGEFLGSAVTFAAAGKTSAPGQMPVEKVRNILEIIHMYN